MSSKEAQDLSVLICTVLDNLGYKDDMISFRVSYADKMSENYKSLILSMVPSFPIKPLSVGSIGEGFRHKHSDIDLLMVLENIQCADRVDANSDWNVLETDYTNTAPGYTKVVLKQNSSSIAFHLFHFEDLFQYKTPEGYPYIPSEQLTNFFKDIAVKDTLIKTSGPAFTMLTGAILPVVNVDIVLSFYYLGKSHLNKWASRIRHFSWPSNETIREVSMMPGYIVPIGDKQSDLPSFEWRICYTTAEKKLVSSLSHVHKKLYIILKIFAKRILKPVCTGITSYVIKNVVFWVAEGMPTQKLSLHLLINQFQRSLLFIKHCLRNNHLPNFMIPERNLLRGTVFAREKQTAISTLTECLKDETTIVTKIPNLQKCITYMLTQPVTILTYGRWRDEVERHTMEFLTLIQRFIPLLHDQTQNTTFRWVRWFQLMKTLTITDVKQTFNLVKLLIPEFPNMIIRGEVFELIDLINARLKATMIL